MKITDVIIENKRLSQTFSFLEIENKSKIYSYKRSEIRTKYFYRKQHMI